MALRATGEIEGVGGGDYKRLYIPSRVSTDSQFPFRAGDGVRLEVVKTKCNREVLVVTSEALEVDQEATDLELRRSTTEIQTSLEDAEGQA